MTAFALDVINVSFFCTVQENLQKHLEKHNSSICTNCGYTTNTTDNLKSHICKNHISNSVTIKFMCVFCDSEFLDKQDHASHVKSHDYTSVKKEYLESLESENKDLKDEPN